MIIFEEKKNEINKKTEHLCEQIIWVNISKKTIIRHEPRFQILVDLSSTLHRRIENWNS